MLKACTKTENPFTVHVFGGDAPPDRRFRKRLATCQNNGRVILYPATKELPTLLRAFDGALFPSRYEGCSYSLLECLEAGLPVIAAPGATSGLVGGHPNLHLLQGNSPLELINTALQFAGQSSDIPWEQYTVNAQAERIAKEYRHRLQMHTF